MLDRKNMIIFIFWDILGGYIIQLLTLMRCKASVIESFFRVDKSSCLPKLKSITIFLYDFFLVFYIFYFHLKIVTLLLQYSVYVLSSPYLCLISFLYFDLYDLGDDSWIG